MKRFAMLALLSCGGADQSALFLVRDGAADISIEAFGQGDAMDLDVENDSSAPDARDGSAVDVGIDSGKDSATCIGDAGSCMPGACCNALHCVSGACSSCKPKGYIALFASECCDPQTFSGSSCGPAQDKCGIPNYSGCMNGTTCCPGSSCKWMGNYWQCTCGIVDAPCTSGVQCCSGTCGQGGWCTL